MKPNTLHSMVAIVVTYNKKELLRECIGALIAQTIKDLDIIIIDNASSDGTKEYIQDYVDDLHIEYYNTGKNLGGAGGFNYGVRVAAEKGYDYLWLMDDDTIPFHDALEHLLDVSIKLGGKFGFLCSYAQFTDGSVCIMNIPDIEGKSWTFNRDFLNHGIIQIKRASFVSFLIPRYIVMQVGLPIKEFFIWADDTEYSKRISKEYPCYFVADSVVIHKMKENIGADNDDFINGNLDRIERFEYKYRNRTYLAKREGVKSFCQYMWNILKTNIGILKARKYAIRKMGILWRGFIKGIFFHPSIEYIDER